MEFELLASGYGLIEGPRVDERNRLYFSDLFAAVYRRNPDGTIETLIAGRKNVGGIGLCANGTSIIVSGRQLTVWDEKSGQSRDLIGAEVDGRPVRALNDLQTDSHGSIWIGSVEFNVIRNEPVKPGRLFRLDPDGKLSTLWEGSEISNGMGFSPDEKLLYHCDSSTGAVWAYDVTAERTVKDRRIFAKLPDDSMPDGMAVDVEGGVLVAVVKIGEVIRYKSDGTLDWRQRVPNTTFVTSLTLGGADMQDLYVVTAKDDLDVGKIYRTRVSIPGLPVPKARFQP